jgi:hypothetical protein
MGISNTWIKALPSVDNIHEFSDLIPSLLCYNTPPPSSKAQKGMNFKANVAQIEAIEASRVRAILEADLEVLGNITDDDYLHVDSSGAVRTKGEFLDKIRQGDGRYERYSISENNIRIYANSAVVMGVFENTYRPRHGDCIMKRARHIRVYVRRDDGWRNVSHQATSLT